MRRETFFWSVGAPLSAAGLALLGGAAPAPGQAVEDWPIHSMERPDARAVDPGPSGRPVPPPSDALVLFDGRDLSRWVSAEGGAAGWKVEDGYLEIVPGAGDLVSDRPYGDSQLHVEWWAPPVRAAEGAKGWANSGVFFGGRRYEVQILETYGDRTYADGRTGAVYGQHPPLVDASRPPGEWQSFDIVFRGPRFDTSGRLLRPARVTVLHNGVLVQDAVELTGPTAHRARPPYEPHPERLPIALQAHGSVVRFRNIWIREIADGERAR